MKKIVLIVAMVASIALFGCSVQADKSNDTTAVHAGKYTIEYPSSWGEPQVKPGAELLGADVDVYFVSPEKDGNPAVAFADLSATGKMAGTYLTSIRPAGANGESDSIEIDGMPGLKTWWEQGTDKVTVVFLSDNAEVSAVIVSTVSSTEPDEVRRAMDNVVGSLRISQ